MATLLTGVKPYTRRLNRLLQGALPKHMIPSCSGRDITRARHLNPALLPRLFTGFGALQRLSQPGDGEKPAHRTAAHQESSSILSAVWPSTAAVVA